jgi:nitric oxide reductase NorE protein
MSNISNKINFEPEGGILVWLVTFVEILTFSLALIFFLSFGKDNIELYENAVLALNKKIALINTIILINSGFFMAQAVKYIKAENYKLFRFNLLLVVVFGLLFVLLKLFDYDIKYQHQLFFDTNIFYTFYYLLTFFHLIHVVFGLFLIVFFYFNTKYDASYLDNMLATAVFWHMCDLIWILLYPILYLIY